MAALTVRGLSEETHRALKARARRNRRSTEAEVRAILDSAVAPGEGLGIGTLLAEMSHRAGGFDVEFDLSAADLRDDTEIEPVSFE